MSLSDADLYQRGAKTLIACWEVTGAGAFAKAARRWHDSAPATEKLAAQSRAADTRRVRSALFGVGRSEMATPSTSGGGARRVSFPARTPALGSA